MAVELIVFCYIFLFVYASLTKLMHHDKFRIQIGQSSILEDFAPVIAWGIPVLELLLAASLVFRRTRLTGMYGATSLMVLFSLYISYVINFSPHVPCSCGGILEGMGWTEHLVFNLMFVLAGTFVIVRIEITEHSTIDERTIAIGQGMPKT